MCRMQGPRSFRSFNLGVFQRCLFRKTALAAVALAFAALASSRARKSRRPSGQGRQEGRRIFRSFSVIDDRVTFSWIPNANQPGMLVRANPTARVNANTAKQVYSFTHFDIWAVRHQLLHHLAVQVGSQRSGQPLHQRRRSQRKRVASRRLARAPARSTACSARPSAGTRSSTPRPSPWGRCTTSRLKSAWTPTQRTATSRRQARRRRRSAVPVRPAVQGLLQRRAVGVLGVLQPQRLRPVQQRFHRSDLPADDLPERRQHLLQADLGG